MKTMSAVDKIFACLANAAVDMSSTYMPIEFSRACNNLSDVPEAKWKLSSRRVIPKLKTSVL